MRRLLLAVTILATIGLASAADDVSERANSFGVLSGSTLTCSATTQVAGCYLERRVLTLGDLEFTVGVDAQAAWDGRYTSNKDARDAALGGHLAPYVGLAWYADTWSTWLELYLPDSSIPTIGRPEWFRLGFTWRLP